ncbi:MAG: PilZ domain-containing protein [Acidobacteriota bacterium]|nr:PilZ domain-containing protein [Acidobacteriota bacterium]
MSISQRKHIRLTLNIPAIRHTPEGERLTTLLYQISIGGCFIEWDESIEEHEEFLMEVQLPDKNWLPLCCKALYRFPDDGIGVQFQDISEFEQQLIVKVMSNNLELEGIPMEVDPFAPPKTFIDNEIVEKRGSGNDSEISESV